MKINTQHLGFHITKLDGSSSSSSGVITTNLHSNEDEESHSNTVSKAKRLNGDLPLDMSDKDLKSFFEDELRSETGNEPNVREIPNGDVLFTMCVFKGKTRPVLAFMDSGCNVWVANDEIPMKELRARKLKDGPIPMGVASGITIQASGEWGALIPLADGGQQVVRGLTLMRVTGDMPAVDMKKLFNCVKKEYGSTSEVDSLGVPSCMSGRVDMIIGIKYNSIYPELVHQYPNGLAVYKSKLLPESPNAVACFGGPVGAFKGMMEAMEDMQHSIK